MNKLIPSILFTALSTLSLSASITFETDYDRGKLVGQNGWTAFEKNPSSPVVYDTQGAVHPDFTWAVQSSKPTSSDDWAINKTASFDLAPDDKVVVEITATREIHPKGAGNGVMFGFGTKLMDKVIGLNHNGVYFRDGWGRTVRAIDADGNNWNGFGSNEVVVLRSIWDLGAGTASLSIKNLSQGETEFTQLYFNKAQTQTTVGLGTLGSLDSWDTIFIRLIGTKAAKLFKADVSKE